MITGIFLKKFKVVIEINKLRKISHTHIKIKNNTFF